MHKEGTQIPEVDFFYRCPSLTGKPGRLQSMGLQRVGHDLTKEQQQLPFEVLENGGDLVICTFWFVCVCVWLTTQWSISCSCSMLEDDMAGWHHRCNEHELGQTPGDGEGQGDLTCCSPWGRKDLDTTGRLNNNNNP